jgi:hypothetical protein
VPGIVIDRLGSCAEGIALDDAIPWTMQSRLMFAPTPAEMASKSSVSFSADRIRARRGLRVRVHALVEFGVHHS